MSVRPSLIAAKRTRGDEEPGPSGGGSRKTRSATASELRRRLEAVDRGISKNQGEEEQSESEFDDDGQKVTPIGEAYARAGEAAEVAAGLRGGPSEAAGGFDWANWPDELGDEKRRRPAFFPGFVLHDPESRGNQMRAHVGDLIRIGDMNGLEGVDPVRLGILRQVVVREAKPPKGSGAPTQLRVCVKVQWLHTATGIRLRTSCGDGKKVPGIARDKALQTEEDLRRALGYERRTSKRATGNDFELFADRKRDPTAFDVIKSVVLTTHRWNVRLIGASELARAALERKAPELRAPRCDGHVRYSVDPERLEFRTISTGGIAPQSTREEVTRGFHDIFCGMGGFSAGLVSAGLYPVRAVDGDEDACQAYANNIEAALKRSARTRGSTRIADFTDEIVECRTISDDEDDWTGTREEAIDRASKDRRRKPLLLVGGLPCQRYSTANRQRTGVTRHDDEEDDDRKLGLARAFVAELIASRAPYFALEEVVPFIKEPGTGDEYVATSIDYEMLTTLLHDEGFQTVTWVLRASNYGVPQRRERVFVIGARAGWELPSRPPETHRDPKPFRSISEKRYALRLLPDRFAMSNPRLPDAPTFAEALRLDPDDALREDIDERNACRLRVDEPTCVVTSQPVPHPTERRTLTDEERLALFGAEPWFRVYGTTKESRLRQVGNLVCPPVARAVGEAILAAAVASPNVRVLDGL